MVPKEVVRVGDEVYFANFSYILYIILPPAAMPLMDIVRLDTMVTVVDSSVFLDAYISRDSLLKRPELGES